MRHLINLIEMKYPKRQGSTPAAYKQFILDVMHYRLQKYGDAKWNGNVGDDLSKSGIKVAQQMEQEGIVTVTTASDWVHVRRGGPRTGQPYRTERLSFTTFAIEPGPNFPEL